MTNRVIRLDEHVGRVIADLFPADDEAYLLCLTSQQLSIIRQHVFPYAHWQTRFVNPVVGNAFECTDDVAWLAYHQHVEDLEDSLEGDAMPCSDILTGLQAVAAAIAAMNTCNTTVNCGSGVEGIGGVIKDLPNDEILPPVPVTEPPVYEGDPPEGFDTWEAYLDHKCKAAWFLWATIRNLISTFQILSGVAVGMAVVWPAIWAWVVSTGVLFPPAGILVLATLMLGFLVLAAGASYGVTEALEYWDANKNAIICAMYASGSAEDAIDVLADFYENAIESIVWYGALAPLGPVLAAALAEVGATAINTSMVNVLFTLAADVIVPEADCSSCVQPDATEWHFDLGVEGWAFVGVPPSPVTEQHGWRDAEAGKDPNNGSPGRLFVDVNMVAFNPPSYYPTWQRSLLLGMVASTGDSFAVHIYAGEAAFVKAGIEYSDSSIDDSGWVGNWVNWGTLSVSVAAPNNGKTISKVFVTFEKRSTGTVTFCVDHAVLTL